MSFAIASALTNPQARDIETQFKTSVARSATAALDTAAVATALALVITAMLGEIQLDPTVALGLTAGALGVAVLDGGTVAGQHGRVAHAAHQQIARDRAAARVDVDGADD